MYLELQQCHLKCYFGLFPQKVGDTYCTSSMLMLIHVKDVYLGLGKLVILNCPKSANHKLTFT